MIFASDFRKGTKFVYKGDPHIVVDFQHVKPGKGGAFVRTKMKNMITGSTYEETFRVDQKFEDPAIEYRDMQYLYADEENYSFMDQESFEQVFLTKEQLGDVVSYLKEQETYTIVYFREEPIAVNPPLFVVMQVVETPPGVRGNTAQGGATKPATLESGFVVQVPLFINEGDAVKIDTRDGSYIERV